MLNFFKKCEHDVNNENTTVTLLDRSFMVFPGTKLGKCAACGKQFLYGTDKEGKYKKIEVKKK